MGTGRSTILTLARRLRTLPGQRAMSSNTYKAIQAVAPERLEITQKPIAPPDINRQGRLVRPGGQSITRAASSWQLSGSFCGKRVWQQHGFQDGALGSAFGHRQATYYLRVGPLTACSGASEARNSKAGCGAFRLVQRDAHRKQKESIPAQCRLTEANLGRLIQREFARRDRARRIAVNVFGYSANDAPFRLRSARAWPSQRERLRSIPGWCERVPRVPNHPQPLRSARPKFVP